MMHGVLTTRVIHIRSTLKPELDRASRSQPISRFQEQEHLAQVDWHVSLMKTHILRQRVRVKHARDAASNPNWRIRCCMRLKLASAHSKDTAT
jgi:hypothetical protein